MVGLRDTLDMNLMHFNLILIILVGFKTEKYQLYSHVSCHTWNTSEQI
jgi:hypothetical protein